MANEATERAVVVQHLRCGSILNSVKENADKELRTTLEA